MNDFQELSLKDRSNSSVGLILQLRTYDLNYTDTEVSILHYIISQISIYHTSEQYFSRTLIGQLGGDKKVLFISEQPRKNKMAIVGILSEIQLLFGPLVIPLVSVVYAKTVIHLSVGESGGYLPGYLINNFSPTIIHRSGGEQWWIFAEPPRRGKYPPLSPTLR